MKKIIITVLIILFNLFNTKANSDSLTYKIDSIYNTEISEINDSIIEPHEEYLNFENKLDEEKQKSSLKKIGNVKLKSNLKAANWFSDAWDAFTDLFKPVWGYYEEDGYRSEGPYFLFDRTYNGPTYVQIQMQQVQEKIKLFPKSNERFIYEKIFELAGTTTIDNCNSNEGICASAARAKASAFVYLVGLNATGTALSTTDREGYRNRAIDYMYDVDIPGLHNFWDALTYVPFSTLGPIGGGIGALSQWEKLVWRAKELQMLCQTWDMLRWCYNIDPTLPNNSDVRERLTYAGQQIMDRYATPLHKRAVNGVYTLAHNNYNLIVGSALASAAICFHDFGTYFFLINKKPDRWANSAYTSPTVRSLVRLPIAGETTN